MILAMLEGFNLPVNEYMVDARARALEEFSIEAVAYACNRFTGGAITDRDNAYPPTSAELAREARGWFGETPTRRMELPPPEINLTPEARARIAAGFKKLGEDLGAPLKAKQEEEDALWRATLRKRHDAMIARDPRPILVRLGIHPDLADNEGSTYDPRQPADEPGSKQ